MYSVVWSTLIGQWTGGGHLEVVTDPQAGGLTVVVRFLKCRVLVRAEPIVRFSPVGGYVADWVFNKVWGADPLAELCRRRK